MKTIITQGKASIKQTIPKMPNVPAIPPNKDTTIFSSMFILFFYFLLKSKIFIILYSLKVWADCCVYVVGANPFQLLMEINPFSHPCYTLRQLAPVRVRVSAHNHFSIT